MQLKILDIIQTAKEPVVEPVQLEEAKTWLIVDLIEDDNLITQLIVSTRLNIERLTKRALVPSTVVFVFFAERHVNEIKLPRIPLKSITKIELQVSQGVWQEQDITTYNVIGENLFGFFRGIFRITYDVGYELDNTNNLMLPPVFKDAIKQQLAYVYENRGDEPVEEGLCTIAEKILLPYINMAWV
jgi:hypothetical protein